jgi:hypothetical protein
VSCSDSIGVSSMHLCSPSRVFIDMRRRTRSASRHRAGTRSGSATTIASTSKRFCLFDPTRPERCLNQENAPRSYANLPLIPLRPSVQSSSFSSVGLLCVLLSRLSLYLLFDRASGAEGRPERPGCLHFRKFPVFLSRPAILSPLRPVRRLRRSSRFQIHRCRHRRHRHPILCLRSNRYRSRR